MMNHKINTAFEAIGSRGRAHPPAPQDAILNQRINQIIEATPPDYGAIVSIHRSNWYLSVTLFTLLIPAQIMMWTGFLLAKDEPFATVPGTLMLVLAASAAGLGAITLMGAGLAGMPPRLTAPGLSNTAEVCATVAGNCILLLPFLLIGAWNAWYIVAGVGLALSIQSIRGLWRWSHYRDGLAVLFEYGLSYSFDGAIKSFSWDEISEVHVAHTKRGKTLFMISHSKELLDFFDTTLENSNGLYTAIVDAIHETQHFRSIGR